jgi:hypothetical protein
MTQDDIIKLMQQACDPDKKPAWHNGFWTITQEELERFADLVAKAERTACADLVSGYLTSSQTLKEEIADLRREIEWLSSVISDLRFDVYRLRDERGGE